MSNKETPKPTRSQQEAKAADAVNLEVKSKSAKAKVPASDDVVLFVSTAEEVAAFSIRAGGQEIRGIRNPDKRSLIFRVPAKLVDAFSKHEFVVNGRLVRAKE